MDSIKPFVKAKLGDLVTYQDDWMGIVIKSDPSSFEVYWLLRNRHWPDYERSTYFRDSDISEAACAKVIA